MNGCAGSTCAAAAHLLSTPGPSLLMQGLSIPDMGFVRAHFCDRIDPVQDGYPFCEQFRQWIRRKGDEEIVGCESPEISADRTMIHGKRVFAIAP